ncbi:MAG: hypothetical protein NUV99_04275 [Clostridia bacterium]|jgi:antitoxin (DNA-binding transcriptional repressor) of toxin-antitoxin stability system|nr:hypothetical protein [Clostridia bacterium]
MDCPAKVVVRRRIRHYGGQISLTDNTRPVADAVAISAVEDGTAEVVLDMQGCYFADDAAKASFDQAVADLINSHPHGPDDFDDDDRNQLKELIEGILCEYFESGRIVRS